MPKIKTHKGASKRFKITADGKIKRSRAFKSHILTKKNRKRKRRLGKPDFVFEGEKKSIQKMLPY